LSPGGLFAHFGFAHLREWETIHFAMNEAFDSYQALASALRERLAVIADRTAYSRDPAAHMESLKQVSERIVTLQGQLPEPVDPQLAHFLERCSYDKALAFIENLQTA
jgi:hypothetical protein